MTAVEVIEKCVDRADVSLRERFGKDGKFIKFQTGRSVTIENAITLMQRSSRINPFPVVCVFAEGLQEWRSEYFLEFRVPKIAIAIRTKRDTDDRQKLRDSFGMVLHPILEAVERELKKENFGYVLTVKHTDVRCQEGGTGTSSLNDLCDAVLIRDLRMKIIEPRKC